MKKRLIAMILCVAMLLTMDLYIHPVAAEEASPKTELGVVITLDGTELHELALPSDEKRVLTAAVQGFTAVNYQWQVLMQGPSSVWVNIYDKTEADCEISEVVLREMLDETNAAFVRCRVSDEEGSLYYSDTLGVLITEPQEPEPADPLLQPIDEEPTAFRSARTMLLAATEYVSVTIKYLDFSAFKESGIESAIYSPYKGTIEYGSDFVQTVVSPTFLGFAPFYDPSGADAVDAITTDATQVSVNLHNLTENVEICVFYKPIEVNFAVRYFFQNVGDDLYTENVALYHTDKAETGAIISDDYLLAQAGGEIEGFAMMYHIPENVAADGSTVFECYFDRRYYLMQFNLDNGYGVEPIYARYGTVFIVNDPVKHGYVFKGWDLLTADTDDDGTPDLGDGVADKLPNTIPNGHQHYKALWQTVNTTYTVAYWATNSEGDYEYLGSKILSAQSGSYTTPPTDDLKTSPVCGEVQHTHDAGCCSIEPHVHSNECCTVENASGCTKEEHTHTTACYGNCSVCPGADHDHVLSCYTTQKPPNPIGTALECANKIENPENGYVYRYAYPQYDWGTATYYNFFRCGGQWYQLQDSWRNSTQTSYGISYRVSTNPSNNSSTRSENAVPLLSHTHTSDCLSCEELEHTHDDENCVLVEVPHVHGAGLCSCAEVEHDHTSGCDYSSCTIGSAHTHSAACYNTNPYLEFDAEKTGTTSVLVEGDGSTVVNVYYKYKTYTLRFYYARKSGSTYQVVGGSTWPFGYNYNGNNKNTTVEEALAEVTAWGAVGEAPTVYTKYTDPASAEYRYNLGTLDANGFTYYYLEFSAQFGANLSKLWPVDIFDPVDLGSNSYNSSPTTGKKFEYAYFSAWNGEYKVKYTQDHYGDNQTIKGMHLYLDEDVIYSSVDTIAGGGSIEDGSLVNFLGFWENGANVGWSVPKKFTYKLMCDDVTPGVYDQELYPSFVVYDDSNANQQTKIDIPGYTYIGRDGTQDATNGPEGMYAYTVVFQYTRQTDVGITYYNYGGVVLADVHATFGKVLSDYYPNYTSPPYPSVLEQNAYLFEGWYTTPECLPVSRVDVTTETIPHYDMALYANWVPTTHKVNFFTTLDEMKAYEADPTSVTPYQTFDAVVHGNIVGSVTNPERTGDGGIGLVFGGWFYMDAGQKRAFSPLAIPVNRDINVFADWSSHSPQPYRIDYVLMDDPDVAVADPSTGFAYAGSTRTFQAKAGSPYNQLYDGFNEGFFPTIASHSITMQYEEDKENPVHNTHTFYYVEASNIEYTVRYINKVTGVEMGSKTMTTSQAVVTERFVAYPDMVPDAFYKRLVISVEYDTETGKYVGTDDNEIIFYYMPNETSAFYAVHFMLEKLHDPSLTPDEIAALRANYAIDGSGGYEESPNTHMEGTGTIGAIESINPLVFPGFELITNHAVTVTGAGGSEVPAPYKTDHYELKVSADGTELYIFYSRKQFDYQVHYYKYNTTEPVDSDVAPSETHTGFYNSTVGADAKVVGGYTCVSATHQEILIRQEESQNVIIFYYAPVQYVVEYILVPPEGGWLSNTIEVKTGSEDFAGATPNVSEFYNFVDWFTDAACTIPVTADMCTVDPITHHLTPIKAALSEIESNKFYAKLVPKGGNLTITRSDATDPEQVFVYEILNNTTGEVINVTVVGNGSVTVQLLQFGEYTVTQKNEWSWRYGDSASSVTHNTAAGTTVLFKAPTVDDQWLHDNSELILNQKGDTT